MRIEPEEETGKKKASILFGAGWEDDSLEVLWRDPRRAFCRLWRGDADEGRYAFIPIRSDAEHPILESVNRLAHEFQLREYLDSTWGLRPSAFVRDRGQTLLLVEYMGGPRSLYPPAHGDRTISPIRSCPVGRAPSAPRTRAHSQGHQPANVLADAKTGHVWLTGFGIASRLPRERQSPEPPEFIEGTLAYLAATVVRQAKTSGEVGGCPFRRGSLFILGMGTASKGAANRDLVFLSQSWSRCPTEKWVRAILEGVWTRVSATLHES